MKKFSILLFAAASIFAVASCERDELTEPVQAVAGDGETTTITLAFDDTKTALVDGKTTWVAGDKVRIYSKKGTTYQDVEVPESAAGKAAVEVEVNMRSDTLYAVYPVESANGIVSDTLVSIVLPAKPDGLFASANICVAVAKKSTTLKFKNVTSVLKVNVNSGNVVEILQVKAQNAMNGTFTVGYDEAGVPELTATSTSRSATVAIGGIDGDYYIPVAPGAYASEFAMTALRGNGGYQTVQSSRENTLVVNTIYNLGTIGSNLSTGLPGEGTEASPYTISNDGEFGAFLASVNMGNPYSGKYVSLNTELEEPVQSPVGFYNASDDQSPFGGIFLGNNHTVKVDIDEANVDNKNYMALFGVLDEGGAIKDLKVSGSVKAEGDYSAGVVAYVRGSADAKAYITNCTSDVVVASTGDRVGGIAGYATQAEFDNCTNNGKVDGNNSVAGIVGYTYYATVVNSRNTAPVTSNATNSTGILSVANGASWFDASNYNAGTGGIIGWAQNSEVKDCSNSADITAFVKVGGIVGSTYWTNVTDVTNSGNITGKGYREYNIASQMGTALGSGAGGAIGYQLISGTLKNATNSGNVKGYTGVGGLVGVITSNQSVAPKVINVTNTGNVTTDISGGAPTSETGSITSFPRGVGGMNPGTGGIIGSAISMRYAGTNPVIEDCVNKGEVFSNAVNVGGILGLSYDAGNSTAPVYKYIDRCVNEGNVTGGPYRVGGILGYTFSRYVGRTAIRNCANHGTITGTRETNGGTVVGGIAGGCGANVNNYRGNAGHISIYNCYNDGDVLYSTATLIDPYVGGIIGFVWGNSAFGNLYNVAYVGPANKTAEPASGAEGYLGALAGNQYADYLNYAFHLEGIAGGRPVGTAGNAARTTTICTFDKEGTLSQDVTANNKQCGTLLEVLNEWQNYYVGDGNVYYNWVKGSNGYPVFDTTMN